MTRPNFLIIQADQLTAKVLSSYGHQVAKTPHIDRLAAAGTVFQNAYCSFPLCGPSRASMMTGQLASRVGAFDNAAVLGSEVPTFAHYLGAAGYRTTLSGKMHFIGADQLHGFEERLTPELYPTDFTWTENLDNRDARNKSDNRTVTQSGICDRSVQLDHDELAVFRAEQHLWDLARFREPRPFCLVVSLTHPHDPFFCPEEHYNRYSDAEIPMPTVPRDPWQTVDPLGAFISERHELRQDFDPVLIRRARRAYLGAVSYFDDQVGRLHATLEKAGLAEDTVIVILSDQGEFLGERGDWLKRHHYEWSSRVPMIFSGAGIPAGRRRENVTLMDLMPTLVAMSGSGGRVVEPLDGRDLSPLIRGDAAGFDNLAIAELMSDGLAAPVVMVRRERWKLITGPDYPPQLFDMLADPDEVRNLATDPAHADCMNALVAEAASIWDFEALQRRIDLSIARRLVIRDAHASGIRPVWRHDPEDWDGRWCRAGSDYTGWALDILNPR